MYKKQFVACTHITLYIDNCNLYGFNMKIIVCGDCHNTTISEQLNTLRILDIRVLNDVH